MIVICNADEGGVFSFYDDADEAAAVAEAAKYGRKAFRSKSYVPSGNRGAMDPLPADREWIDPEAGKGTTVVAKVEFYRRCSDAEAVAIEQAFAAKPLRLRRIFDAAQTFRSDAEEWPLLQGAAVALFGEARASELLAPTA